MAAADAPTGSEADLGAGVRVAHLGGLRVDPRCRRAVFDGRVVDLTTREFDILAALASHPGWVYSAEQLSQIEPFDYRSPGAVTVHVAHLRRKLARVGCTQLIATVRGSGYRLEVMSGERPGCGTLQDHAISTSLEASVPCTRRADGQGDADSEGDAGRMACNPCLRASGWCARAEAHQALVAGRGALARSAFGEAIQFLQHGLQLLGRRGQDAAQGRELAEQLEAALGSAAAAEGYESALRTVCMVVEAAKDR